MCQSAQIRYGHTMVNAEYAKPLVVGCVCAERMEEDYVNPRLRENKLKSTRKKRSNWLIKGWKVSGKGDPYKDDGHFHVVVYPTSWLDGENKMQAARPYRTNRAARRGTADQTRSLGHHSFCED